MLRLWFGILTLVSTIVWPQLKVDSDVVFGFFFNTAVTVLAQLLLQVVIEKQQYHMRFL